MKKTSLIITLTITLLLSICLGSYCFFTPHLTVFNMKKALEKQDSIALSKYIDFQSIRNNLKSSIMLKMAKELKSDNDLLTPLTIGLASAFINPMIDNLVTPEGLKMLMEGKNPLDNSNDSSITSDINITMGYCSSNSSMFIVVIKNKISNDSIRFILTRYNLIFWKLTRIQLEL